jgi:hypothetical protein
MFAPVVTPAVPALHTMPAIASAAASIGSMLEAAGINAQLPAASVVPPCETMAPIF